VSLFWTRKATVSKIVSIVRVDYHIDLLFSYSAFQLAWDV